MDDRTTQLASQLHEFPKVGARASRIVRVLRLVRVVKLYKALLQAQAAKRRAIRQQWAINLRQASRAYFRPTFPGQRVSCIKPSQILQRVFCCCWHHHHCRRCGHCCLSPPLHGTIIPEVCVGTHVEGTHVFMVHWHIWSTLGSLLCIAFGPRG